VSLQPAINWVQMYWQKIHSVICNYSFELAKVDNQPSHAGRMVGSSLYDCIFCQESMVQMLSIGIMPNGWMFFLGWNLVVTGCAIARAMLLFGLLYQSCNLSHIAFSHLG